MKIFDSWDDLVNFLLDNCFRGTANGFNKYRPMSARYYGMNGVVETVTWDGRNWRDSLV